MKIYIRIGLILLAAMLIFSCRRQDPSSGAPGESLRELRFGLTTEPQTLDPLSPANTADGRSILFNVFEGLVKPDATGRLYPAVAESYRIEENGRIYVFALRQGIQFHNGETLLPGDVIFSLNRAAEAHFTGLNNIAGIEYINSELRITLIEPDPEFLPFLTVGIVPERNQDRERNPIGTGPFMIESYAPLENLRLVKNPYYWQAELPMLDRVTIVFVANSDALITSLMGGNIDGAVLTGAMIPLLDSDRFDIFPWHSNTVQLLVLNNARSPLDDLRVRRALNYALDIQDIIDIAFFGMGEPSGSPLIPALSYVYEESLRDPFPRDINQARTLLTEAGFFGTSNGPGELSLEIVVPSNYTMHVDTAQVIVNQLAAAGINTTIRLVDWGTWLAEVRQDRNFEATIISLDARDVSPRSFLARYQSWHSGNFMNFRNDEYDRLFSEVLSEPDEQRRISMYRELQRIISENAAGVFIQDIMGFWAFRGGLFNGVVNYPLYIIDFATIYKREQRN
jgi:peptide/nickel transport system substrate-binding protein